MEHLNRLKDDYERTKDRYNSIVFFGFALFFGLVLNIAANILYDAYFSRLKYGELYALSVIVTLLISFYLWFKEYRKDLNKRFKNFDEALWKEIQKSKKK